MSRLTAVRALFFMVSLLLTAAGPDGVVKAAIVPGLQVGFYSRTCPQVEEIVRDVVDSEVRMDITISPGLIRIFFHDCFITGCDASILLDESPSGDVPEKESSANGFTLHGLRTIDVAKSTVEAMCPNTVSCADILAFATRDAAVAAGLPSYEVAAGRRDGMRSRMDDLPGNFPVPGHNVPQLTVLFQKRGLSQEDLVVLSGAHSIGGAHCFMFSNRIYGFSNTSDVDPSLEPAFATRLRKMCPPPNAANDPETAPKVNFDQPSGQKLDSSYYKELLAGRGLLTSDTTLVQNPETKPKVELFASNEVLWKKKFAEAMQKVSAIDVLVGTQKGEVRRNCRLVNKDSEEQESDQQVVEEPDQPVVQESDQPVVQASPWRKRPLMQMINWRFTRGFH